MPVVVHMAVRTLSIRTCHQHSTAPGGGGGGGVAQLVVVPLAMGRGAKSPGFDSHRGLSFQKGREDGWIGLNPPPGVHGSSPSYASGRLTV